MDYKEKVIALLNDQDLTKEQKEKLENIFPELQESEDERIRKGLIKAVSGILKGNTLYGTDVTREEALAWLEKQEQEPKKVSIWKHWKNGIAGHVDGKQIYLTKKDNIYSISSCLGFECDYIELSELDNLMLEKQEEKKPADKVEPKFRPGDWITDGHLTCKVLSVTGKFYELHLYNDDYCHFETDVQSVDKRYHLWTIQDAKDGDVLVDSYSKDSLIILYKGINKEQSILAHCGWNGYNFSIKTNGLGYGGLDNTNYLPATKEQQDLLFAKMKEAGYEWDSEKKELKQIEPKKIDADKVIAWLVANICHFDYYVKLFKKDFGL